MHSFNRDNGEENKVSNTVHMPKEMADAILKVMDDFGSLRKTGFNEHGRYNFAPVDDFYDRTRKLFPKYGLVITSTELESDLVPMTAGTGNAMKTTIWIKTKWQFKLHHNGATYDDGLYRFAHVPTSGPQTEGIAQSYASKNFMRDLFRVATGEYELDDMAPVEHGVETEPVIKEKVATSEKSAPKTEGATYDESTVAKNLYAKICSPDFTEADVVETLNEVEQKVKTKSRKSVLDAAILVREVAFMGNSTESVADAYSKLELIKKARLDTKYLETLLKSKEAELEATRVA